MSIGYQIIEIKSKRAQIVFYSSSTVQKDGDHQFGQQGTQRLDKL